MGRYEGISVRNTKNSFKYLQSVYGDMVLPSTQIIPSNQIKRFEDFTISLREQKQFSLCLSTCATVLGIYHVS